ncbi:hypothetical protein YC2023_066378 [Brassica napus]
MCVSLGVRQHTQVRSWLSVAVRQQIQDICVCPSAHTGRPWLPISKHISTLVLGLSTLALPVDFSGDFGPRGLCVRYRTSLGVHQHKQDVRRCPSAHRGRLWLSVCVRLCPLEHTGRLWLSISTHSSTLVLGLSTLTLPVDCSGDFGPRGLSNQYTQDVCGCPSAHTRRSCVSVSTNRTSELSVCVRHHTQDVCGCPSVHISARCTHRMSVGVRQHTQDLRGCPCMSVCVYLCPSADIGRPGLSMCPCVSVSTQHVRGCPSVHISARCLVITHRTSVGDCQHTQDVRGCPCVSVCVSLCPSAHKRRPWLSICTHISTLVLGLSTLALPVDCLGDFGTRGLSVQYTQDVCGCPPAHTGHLWLSVAVCQHTQDVRSCPSAHTGRPWLSVCVRVCLWVSASIHKDVCGCCGCPSAHTRRPCVSVSTHKTSVCVRVCPSAHTGRLWLSISTHISTLVLGLSTLALPVDCSGDFGPRGLCVPYTQDVCGCPSAHTGRPCVSVSTQRTSMAVRVCPCVSVSTYRTSVAVHQTSVGVRQHTQDVRGCLSAHIGCPWLSVCVHQHTHDVCCCPSVHISARCTHRTSVGVHQHKQDVRECPSAHTGRPGLSVCVCQHTERPWLSISTHISTLVLGLSTLTIPVDCSGDFGPRWLSVCFCMCPLAHTRRPWLSISTHISTLVLGLSTLALPVDCLGDFSTRGLSVQYTHDIRGCPPAHTGHLWLSVAVRQHTQDVRGCPSAHTGRMWLSVCVHVFLWVSASIHKDVCGCLWLTHRTSVAVHQYTYQHAGPWTQHAGPSRGLFGTSVGVRQHTEDVYGCPCVSVCVRVCPSAHTGHLWYTQDVRGCPSAHTRHPCVSVSTNRTFWAVCVCPSAHTGRPWLSINTHIITLVLGLSMLTLLVDCSSDYGPRGLSGQYTHDVCGCPPPWLSVTHIRTLVLGLSTLALPVDCLGDFGPHGLSVQYTQDVRGCPQAHTGHLWLSDVCGCLWLSVSTHRTSVCVHQHTQDVRVCPSAHIGRPWLSISTYISTLVRGLSMQALPVDCSGRLWVFVSTHMMSVAVHVCPSAHTGRLWLSISTHISTLVVGLSTLTHPVDCSGDFGPRGLSGLYTQDVRGCPPAHTGRPWLSVCVRVCLWVSASKHTTFVAVSGYLSTHTGRPCVSVSTHRTSVCVRVCPSAHRTSVAVHQWMILAHDVCGCPCVSVNTHMTSVAVHQYTYQHIGPWTQHADPIPWTVQVILAHVGCLFSTHRTSVGVRQHTQDVHVCPSAHTGRLGLSVCVRQHTQDVRGCPSIHILARCTHRTSVGVCQHTHDVRGCPCGYVYVRQHTQDVRGCPSVHISARWSLDSARWPFPWTVWVILAHVGCLFITHRTSVGVPSTHRTSVAVCGCLWLSVSTHRTFVAVHGCPKAHTGRPCVSISTQRTSVCVRVHTQDVCGCPSVQISARWSLDSAHWPFPWTVRVILAHVGCVFSTHRMSVGVRQHTQDVRGCPSAHTGRLWLSVCVRVCPSAHTGCSWLSISTHISTLVVGLSTLTLPMDYSGDFGPRGLSVQYTQDVRGCPSAHTGCPCVSVSTHRTSGAVRVCLMKS